jgi:hypothetical protein
MEPTFIVIDGKVLSLEDLPSFGESNKNARQRQPTLFELRDDARLASQRTEEGRFTESTLFRAN